MRDRDRYLWSVAVITHWGIDLPATVVALELLDGTEHNPLPAAAARELGTVPGLVLLQSTVFLIIAGLWLYLRTRGDWRAGWSWILPAIPAVAGIVTALNACVVYLPMVSEGVL